MWRICPLSFPLSFCHLSWLTVKSARVARDNSKGPNSASASSSQAQVGISTSPNDLKMEEQEDEEDGRENSTTDVETDEEGMKLKNRGMCYILEYLSPFSHPSTHFNGVMCRAGLFASLDVCRFLSKFVV